MIHAFDTKRLEVRIKEIRKMNSLGKKIKLMPKIGLLLLIGIIVFSLIMLF